MRKIYWVDEDGYKRLSLVRDNDPDSYAQYGIPVSPPDLRQLDWENIVRDIHNSLFDKGVMTWHDVQRQQTAVTSSIVSALKTRVVHLYRYGDRQENDRQER